MPRAWACCCSSLIMPREEEAMSQTPAIRPQKPEALPLVSTSITTLGWSFLYSAISRGANSSPTVLEPLMMTLSRGGAWGASVFGEQPARRMAVKMRRRQRQALGFAGLDPRLKKVAFIGDIFGLAGK